MTLADARQLQVDLIIGTAPDATRVNGRPATDADFRAAWELVAYEILRDHDPAEVDAFYRYGPPAWWTDSHPDEVT